MEQTARVDAGLSSPLARPTLLLGLTLLLIGALVARRLPPLDQWSFSLWFGAAALTTDFVLVTARRPGPLSRANLAVIVIGSLLVVLLGFGDREELGVIAFYGLGYLTLAGSLLIMRGHPFTGTLVSAVMLVNIYWLGFNAGATVAQQLERLAWPLVTVVAFALIHLMAGSIEGRRSRAVAQQLEALTHADAVRSRSVGEHRALSEIPAMARPVLERIAAGEVLTPAFRAEVLAVNEAVRGHIRRDLPYHAGFLGAIDAARARGVSVQVLGNEDPAPLRMSEDLAAVLVGHLEDDDLAAVTIRFLPRSRGGFMTLLVEGSQGAQRFEFEADGSTRRRGRRDGARDVRREERDLMA